MSLNSEVILRTLESHALASGRFERVNTHEPKNAPGNGLTCAIWTENIAPVQSSGLAQTSARITFNIRIYTNMLQEPQDAIDPLIIQAVDELLEDFNGDFELGGNARGIDLFGQHGVSLNAQAGYIEQDGKLFRVVTITIPVIVNDAWVQAA